jgi:hypothetical protein
MAGLEWQLEFCGVKFLARKVQDSASPLLRQTATPIASRVQSTTTVASKVPSCLQARSGDSCPSPHSFWRCLCAS